MIENPLGYVFSFGIGAVTLSNKKHYAVALSLTKVEY
jgi:hypothetical protein